MFTDTLCRWIENARDATMQNILRTITTPLFDRQSSRTLSSAGLAIKSGGSTLVKTGASATKYTANGVYGNIAAATDMAALVGTVTNAYFNVFCFFVDSAGNLTSAAGTQATTRGAVKFPPFPQGKALIGFIEINPLGTGDFVGGTTALDDGTVTPTAFYVNSVSGFDPACLIGGNT